MSDTPSLHTDRPERFMVIVAHPDDADFGPSGTCAAWIQAGSAGELVCCTSGDAGADDARTDPLELAATRESEQRAAADVIGYQQVTFLHQPDGALENNLALREQLVRQIRRFRPDAVLTVDPTPVISPRGRVQHTDHRAAGIAAIDAVYPAARNAMAFPWLVLDEGLEPFSVHWLYLFWTDRPNAWVDVSDTVQTKLKALHAHASQLREPEKLDERVLEWTAETGAQVGVAAAETFMVVDVL
jgi:LmbE family N-acetylglucosaminyl deacetylase